MNKKKANLAFTLIELLITISILLILLAIGIAQYETYNRRNNLILSATSLKSFIEAARNDAKGRDSTLSIGTSFPSLSLVVEGGGRVINEYRNLDDGSRYKQGESDYIFNSFSLSNKINGLTPGTILTIATPTGEYLVNTTPVTLSIGGEQVTLTVNENSITQTKSGF